MIEIQNSNKNELPEQLNGYTSIEVVEVIGKRDGSHDVLYYCVLDGILTKVLSKGSLNVCLSTLFRQNTLSDRIQETYSRSSEGITGFRPYKSFRSLINKLFSRFEGQSIHEALDNLSTCIRQYQGGADTSQILNPEYGIIIGYEKPDIRRYSDNPKKNTFDVIDIVVKVTLHSNNDLKEWYQEENNRKNLINYALEKIQESKSYAKFNVPTDYLKLNSVGIGTDQYRLIFILKDDNSNHSTANI